MRTVICIPTYNERENLPALVEEILATTKAEVMIVDDHSPDGTGRVAELMAASEARIQVIHRPTKLGVGQAYVAGFRRAIDLNYEQIFQMDADFSHQPRYLPEMIEALANADVVVGSRYVPGGEIRNWSLGRRICSYGGNAYARLVLAMPYHDATAGFVGFRRHVLEAIDFATIEAAGYAFQVELKYRAHRLGFAILEVPIIFHDRSAGNSKMSRRTVSEAVVRLLELRLKGPV